SGLPHWIFLDEAHVPLHLGTALADRFDPDDKGYCLVTYRPDELCGAAQSSFDFLLALAGHRGLDPAAAETVAGIVDAEARTLAELAPLELGQAVLVRLGDDPTPQVVHRGKRRVRLVRQGRKY